MAEWGVKARTVKCASCGFSATLGTDVSDDPDSIARVVKAHLNRCVGRTYGHPMFGFLPRWNVVVRMREDISYEEIEIAWTDATWGKPLNLDAVDG